MASDVDLSGSRYSRKGQHSVCETLVSVGGYALESANFLKITVTGQYFLESACLKMWKIMNPRSCADVLDVSIQGDSYNTLNPKFKV